MASTSRWTTVDYSMLAAVGVVGAVIFYAAWFVWDFFSVLGPLARPLSVGLWFTAAILAATLIRKPGAAFAGEVLAAFIESLLPTSAGFINLLYGILQGLMAELGYYLLRYKRWDTLAGAFAGALSGIGEVLASIIYYREIAGESIAEAIGGEIGSTALTIVAVYWIVANMISGALYGSIAAAIAKAVRR